MALDKWIAALFLAGSVVYGYAAFTYPLFPILLLWPLFASGTLRRHLRWEVNNGLAQMTP